jgi:serine/threonine protein kinase/formylglycine-generating enzyme required for sulfatase activity
MSPSPAEDPGRFARIRELYAKAIGLPAAERAAFVTRAADGDASLVEEVIGMLAADDSVAATHDLRQVVEAAAASSPATAMPELIGPYRILSTLGEGGMGTVYLAEQKAPVRRRVALKLIKLGMDSKAVLARFQAERRALSMMEHSCIASVFDAGMSALGQPYFVMEYVKGISITDYCDQHRLALPERIALFQKVCSGVQHAHLKGVMHRDLKPGNVLVTLQDGKPMPKIIDFGLAKATDHHLVEATLFTERGVLIGTPEYMSPEQAGLGGLDVDTRTDVYSLGVLLYELVVGELPFPRQALREAGMLEMQRMIREREPEKPSTRFASLGSQAEPVAQARRLESRELQSQLRGDLDWIVMKAIEKDRTRRYETAAELAADLERHLQCEPVLAGPPSFSYRLRKFVRRYRLQCAAVTAVLLAIVGGGIGTALGFAAATEQARIAVANEGKARDQELIANVRSEENAQLAQANASLAERQTMLAIAEAAAKEEALHQSKRFDQLAACLLHEQVISREQDLWPPWPHRIPAIEDWLRTSAKLIAMVPDVERTVWELESLALPLSDAERAEDRRTHPRFAEYELAQKRVSSLRHAEALRSGAFLFEPPLTPEQQAMSAKVLNLFAWRRVAPKPSQRAMWGEELLGLALARAAAAKAKGTPGEYEVQDTLAWALVANGQDAAAESASKQAFKLAPADEVPKYEQSLRDISTTIGSAAAELAAAELVVSELEQVLTERRMFRFGETADGEAKRFLHETLAELLVNVRSMQRMQQVEVEKRHLWATRIQELTLMHPNARHRWPAMRGAVARNRNYSGQRVELEDADVLGLVPIGENPVTGLWELYDLYSAWDGIADPATLEIPVHEADGSIKMTGNTGIVFVLVPAGTFWMGAQKEDANQPNYDAEADTDEGPVHRVVLEPFLLARHEITRSQWRRLTGTSPFWFTEGKRSDPIAIGSTHPAESFSWDEAYLWLERHGMSLPTEAQWEYGCRAGTSTRYWSGKHPADLARVANIHDQTSVQNIPSWGTAAPFADGFTEIAPVGSFAANPFGLFDVHGNVWEWCFDHHTIYESWVRSGDGLRLDGHGPRVNRGGAYHNKPSATRSSCRDQGAPFNRSSSVGVRPARRIHM